MSKTPQRHREAIRKEIDALRPHDNVMYSAKLMRLLVNDSERLERAEKLVWSMRQFVQENHDETGRWGSFLDEIDAFLSGRYL